MPGGWEGSNRRAELPPDWYTRIRPRILARDEGRCTWVTEGERCSVDATDVDHIGDKWNHDDVNLAALCGWHHDRKTSRDAQAARRARPQVTERHPTEAHPGLL